MRWSCQQFIKEFQKYFNLRMLFALTLGNLPTGDKQRTIPTFWFNKLNPERLSSKSHTLCNSQVWTCVCRQQMMTYMYNGMVVPMIIDLRRSNEKRKWFEQRSISLQRLIQYMTSNKTDKLKQTIDWDQK